MMSNIDFSKFIKVTKVLKDEGVIEHIYYDDTVTTLYVITKDLKSTILSEDALFGYTTYEDTLTNVLTDLLFQMGESLYTQKKFNISYVKDKAEVKDYWEVLIW